MAKTGQMVKRLATIHTAAELVMVAFAGLSLSNVEQFFHAIHPHGIASWIAGVALGAILVILAGILSRMETNLHNRGYVTVLVVTAGLTLISGLIQGAAYDTHLHWLPAYLLGLSLPGFGELGLALVVAEYTANEKRKRAQMADAGFEERINDAISDALANIDVSQAKRHIERQAAAIIRHKMDGLVAKRIGSELRAEEDGNDDEQSRTADSPDVADLNRPSVAEMNEARQRLAHERQWAIVDLIKSYGPLSTAALVTKLEADRDIKASERTVRADCTTLEEGGELVKAGRRWGLVRTIALALPSAPMPATNGHGH